MDLDQKILMDLDNHQAGGEELHLPHVLIFPFPAQGHVNPMLKLAELFSIAGLRVTFLVTHHTHGRLLRHSDVHSHFARYSGFRFQTIPDGLPENHSRSAEDEVVELFQNFGATAKPLLRELLVSNRKTDSDAGNPITCVVADAPFMSFANDVGEEVGIPIICFRVMATCNFWIDFCFPEFEAGEFPFKGNNLDAPFASVPGMEHFLRRRDLTRLSGNGDSIDRNFQIILNETRQTVRAQALILNTFEDLEGPILTHARSQCPNIYTIGPLHAQLQSRLTTPTTSSNSLWEEDVSCMTWLESQPSRSVIYVSFGSLTMVTKEQLMEFWHGLVNSGKRFLWVIRPDSVVDGKSQISAELLEGTKERGYMVGWVPQEKILAHRAVGGFLTHCGWNSTLESIAAGVPMICWPYFGDQYINSRFVEEIWKLGLDMKDTCDRVIIEKMVRDMMDKRKEEFLESTDRMAKLAKQAISEGGSSYSNLDRLIGFIRSMAAD